MIASLFYNGLFWIFKFPARWLYWLIYGKECWEKYAVVNPKDYKQKEGSLGSMMGLSLIFGIVAAIHASLYNPKYYHGEKHNYALILFLICFALILFSIIKSIIEVKKGQKQIINDTYEKMMSEKEERIAEIRNTKGIQNSVNDREPTDKEFICPYCNNIQSKNIKRCLKCGEMIEDY